MPEAMNPITEDWLRSVGFKWEQLERSVSKNWVLWLGDAVRADRMLRSHDDLGIELSQADATATQWHCWIRADYAGRYTRFVHVRLLEHQEEVIQLIEALTGQAWNPADVLYGCLRTPEQAASLREEEKRLDVRMALAWGKRVEAELKLDPDKIEKVRP